MYVKYPEERAGHWHLREQTMSGAGTSIRFQNKVESIEVRSRSGAQDAESKLGRAAAGAVLGFLIAGPAGTLLGAGSGASSAKSAKSETFGVTVRFVGQGYIMGDVDQAELEKLRKNLVHDEKAPQANGPISTADEINKLVALRDSGVLSDAEFTAAKAKLLS